MQSIKVFQRTRVLASCNILLPSFWTKIMCFALNLQYLSFFANLPYHPAISTSPPPPKTGLPK